MKNSHARKAAFGGVMCALALCLSWLESAVAGAVLLPPGVKLGLANVVVMFSLYCIGRGQALALVVLKACFSLITRGTIAGLLSLCGGLLSFAGIVVLLYLFKNPSLIAVSVCGALLHNAGQLVIMIFLMGPYTLSYAPVLVIGGVCTGILNAVLVGTLLPQLQKLGFELRQYYHKGKKRSGNQTPSEDSSQSGRQH